MFTTLLLAAGLTPGQQPPPVIPPVVNGGHSHTPGKAAPMPATPSQSPSLTDCLRACPPHDESAPFLRTPRVDTVGECRDATAGGCKSEHMWKYTFHKAARFTIPRFDLCGEAVESDGLLIYEGMRLTVDRETGVYDLSFTATAPPTPVTLRLQLEFTNPKAPAEPVRLTLPPIRIEPDSSARSVNPLGLTVRVSHRGYSELFTGTKSQIDAKANYRDVGLHPPLGPTDHFQIDERWIITRAGTARFGSALPNSDETGR